MYKIVILDDESFILDGLKTLLNWEELGFKIDAVFLNPRLAIEYLATNHVDILISDIRMPEISGIELLHELKRRKITETQIILLSGYADFSYAQEALKLGVCAYLLKPVDRQLLIETLFEIKEGLDIKYNVRDDSNPSKLGYYNTIVDTVKVYLEKEYANATLSDAARLVGFSPNYVSKIFKEVTGVKFSDYLQEMKMKRAEKLLLDVNLRIYQVSYAVGYDNPKNFTRAFKQYFGITPWEFREEEGNK